MTRRGVLTGSAVDGSVTTAPPSLAAGPLPSSLTAGPLPPSLTAGPLPPTATG